MSSDSKKSWRGRRVGRGGRREAVESRDDKTVDATEGDECDILEDEQSDDLESGDCCKGDAALWVICCKSSKRTLRGVEDGAVASSAMDCSR